MSMEALRWARGVRGITPTQKLVLMMLADAANAEGECWPSVASLIADTGLSERAVQQALRGLAEADVLTASIGGGRHRTTIYRLNMALETPQQKRGSGNGERETPCLMPETPHEKPRSRNPVSETVYLVPKTPHVVRKTGHHVHPNPKEPIEPIPTSQVEARASRGTRLPADWQPGEAERSYARERGLNPAAVAEAFRDYWHAASGSNAVKRDWSAAWRTWCRREVERRPATRSPPATKPTSKLAWMLDEMRAGPRILLDGEDHP